MEENKPSLSFDEWLKIEKGEATEAEIMAAKMPEPIQKESSLDEAAKVPHLDQKLNQDKHHDNTGTLKQVSSSGLGVDYGVFLLAIPLIGTLLVWYWVAELSLLQAPGEKLNLVVLATVISTAILIAVESSKHGMVTDRDKGTYSPTSWFFITVLFWFIGYPAYLWNRKKYGLDDRFALAVILVVVFIFSVVFVGTGIEEQAKQVQDIISKLPRTL